MIMENGQNQTKYQFRLSTPATIFIIAQIVFIIFLAISIPSLSKPDEINDEDPNRIPVATISNFSSMAPENYSGNVKLMEATLFELILRNSPGQDVSTSVNTFIRENSVNTVYFKDKNVNYFSAILDIPDLSQSYWFYTEYSSDKNNQYIDYSKSYRLFCLEDSQEIIYPDFDCQDDFGLAGRFELVSNLITYFNFNYFSPSYSPEQDANKIKIYPHDFSIDDATKDSYVQQTKDAVASLGISPDFFTYHVIGPKDINYLYPPE